MAWFPRQSPKFWPLPDVTSIRFRLTAGVVLATALGISTVAGWLNWRMHQILLARHQDAVAALSQRLRDDVVLYEDMMPTEAAVQKVIDVRALGDTAIWVRSPSGTPIAQSETLATGAWQDPGLTAYFQALPPQNQLDIVTVGDHTLALCIGSLEIEGNLIGTLFVVEDISQNHRAYVAMTRSLVLISGSVIVLLAGLMALYIQQSLRPLKTLSGEVMGVTAESLTATRLALAQAPTEVRELAQALDHTLESLAQSWEQQRRLVGDMSHELRTPLTLVQGYLQSTLRRCQTLTEPQRDGLETAAAETDRTIQILNDLLVLARASMGTLHLSCERIDLKAVVLEAVAMADVNSDRIELDIQDAPLWVRGDASALRQVLVNLLHNALNYSPVTSLVRVRLWQQEKQAVIQVCDQGRGIPLADQARIFEPFYRVDMDRSRATGGTGLGLAIVKTLLEKMKGHIQVQSQPQAGSTFTVQLPLCQGA